MSKGRNIQAVFEITVGFILAMGCLIFILFIRDASVRVIAVAGIVTTVALLVVGWIMTSEDAEEEEDWDWAAGWRF